MQIMGEGTIHVPVGTVGVVSGELSRYSTFSMDLLRLQIPAQTVWTWAGGISVAANVNQVVLQMHGDWLWLLGDDHRFDASILIDLLTRMYGHDLDAVVPLCAHRKPPFGPVIAERIDAEHYRPLTWQELPTMAGLWPLEPTLGTGTAGLLIRRRTLDAVGYPWFEVGRIKRDQLGEDLWFCEKVHRAGRRMHVATDLRLGHTTTMTIWPAQNAEGVRHLLLELDPNQQVMMPVFSRLRDADGAAAELHYPEAMEWAHGDDGH